MKRTLKNNKSKFIKKKLSINRKYYFNNNKTNYYKKQGYNLKTIIIDTDAPKGGNFDYTLEGGFKFAKLADADYYHSPQITDQILCDIITNNDC